MKFETLGRYLNKKDKEPSKKKKEKTQEEESLEEYTGPSNNDYIVTLNLDEKNDTSRFRDKVGLERLEQTWQSFKELLGGPVSPEEEKQSDSEEVRKLKKKVRKLEGKIKKLKKKGKKISDQKKNMEDIAEAVKEEAEPDTEEDEANTEDNSKLDVAGFIRRGAPLREGNNALANALESGRLTLEQKKQTVKALGVLKKEHKHKWDKENLSKINSVEKKLTQEVEVQASMEKTIAKLAELIKIHKPLKKDNTKLAVALVNEENRTLEVLQRAGKAVEAIGLTINKTQETKHFLEEVSGIIEKEIKKLK